MVDFSIREPVGVCALFLSWNSPLQTLANKLAPALALGNVAIVKPSVHASVSVLEFIRLASDIIPPGVLAVLTGPGQRTGTALASDPEVDLISFTGGAVAGLHVATNAIGRGTRVILELGGKSTNIVFGDADRTSAIEGVLGAAFTASGQSCIAGSRLLLERPIHDAFLAQLTDAAKSLRVGDPLRADTDMGPIANADQLRRIQALLAKGVQQGAVVLTASPPNLPGAESFMNPVIVSDANRETVLWDEEVFGPVLTVAPFDTEPEAITAPAIRTTPWLPAFGPRTSVGLFESPEDCEQEAFGLTATVASTPPRRSAVSE